jgi:diguanylate cyclase (GGDEF)-like protein/PAS domain S-box-containing protein
MAWRESGGIGFVNGKQDEAGRIDVPVGEERQVTGKVFDHGKADRSDSDPSGTLDRMAGKPSRSRRAWALIVAETSLAAALLIVAAFGFWRAGMSLESDRISDLRSGAQRESDTVAAWVADRRGNVPDFPGTAGSATGNGELLLTQSLGKTIDILDPLTTADVPLVRYFRGEGLALTGVLTVIGSAAMLAGLAAISQRRRLKAARIRLERESRLLALERRSLATFEQAPVGIAHLTLDLVILRTNRKLGAILGYAPEELIGLSIRSLIHPDHHAAFDLVRQGLRDGNVEPATATDRRFVRKDGADVFLAVTGTVIRGDHGDADCRIGFYEDVTERRAAQRLTEESEARFRSYVQHAPIAVLATDADGRWIDSNPAALRLLGYPAEGLRGLPIHRTVADADRARIAVDLAAMREEQVLRADYGFCRADGSVVSVELSAVKLAGDRVLAYALDITLREQAKRELQERLRLQDQMMRITASVPGVLYALEKHPDGSFGLPFATSGLLDLVGLDPDGLTADPSLLVERILPQDRVRLGAAIAVSERELSAWHARFRYDHPVKGLRWLEAQSLPKAEPGGRIVWHGFASDITDSRRDAAALRDASAALASADAGVFVVDLSGTITSVNAGFCTMTGYDERDVLGRHISILRSNRHDAAFYAGQRKALEETGHWQHELWHTRKNGDVSPVFLTMKTVLDEDGALVNCVGTFTDISRIKEQERELVHLASHDVLTGLPNRQVFLSRLKTAVGQLGEESKGGAVLFLGLDRFQSINDSLGHPAGDEVLRVVAARIKHRLRDVDTVARHGGDEFGILLLDLAAPEDAGHVARALISQVLEPIHLSGGQELVIGASIGISLFPSDGLDVDELVKNADAALHQAKADGGGIHRAFTEDMTRHVAERFDLEGRLRRAIERQEFVLHYQPLVSLADRRVKGVEALVRWEDPERGRIPPNQFIGLAEETGLIVPLGEWVLRTACAQMQAWRADGTFDGTMAVNLSPVQFRASDIVDRVARILKDTGLPAASLELEITEGALIGDVGVAEMTLTRLKALGVRLAIDDFGTGYSSLAYLKRFPIDTLKIDQSFVRGIPKEPADMEIAGAVISLARSLELKSLAEGIETEAQLEFLRSRGCVSGQGYLFARPMPAGDLSLLLGQRRAA